MKMSMKMNNPYFSVEGATKRLERITNDAEQAIKSAKGITEDERVRLLDLFRSQPAITQPDYASETQIIAIHIVKIKDFIRENLGIDLEG